MNSEKVKEIKKVLNTWKIVFHGITNAEILTYINEIESENERLQEENGALSCDLEIISEKLTNAEIEVDDYKDRIADLEKENEILRKHNIGYHIANKYEAQDQLKQFAERLKEKCEYNRKQYCCEATVSFNDIDETLKEFLL